MWMTFFICLVKYLFNPFSFSTWWHVVWKQYVQLQHWKCLPWWWPFYLQLLLVHGFPCFTDVYSICTYIWNLVDYYTQFLFQLSLFLTCVRMLWSLCFEVIVVWLFIFQHVCVILSLNDWIYGNTRVYVSVLSGDFDSKQTLNLVENKILDSSVSVCANYLSFLRYWVHCWTTVIFHFSIAENRCNYS